MNVNLRDLLIVCVLGAGLAALIVWLVANT